MPNVSVMTLRNSFSRIRFGNPAPVPEGPDPFAPEQHALDIADPVRLHMARQELIEDIEFAGFLRADIDPGRPNGR